MQARLPNRLIAALDTASISQARAWADQLGPGCGLLKLGLEFFLACGPQGAAQLADDFPLFLDLKLNDIPNTVAGGVRSVCRLGASMLTLHANGGAAMIEAARNAAEAAPRRPQLLAVTVLTSFTAEGLAATGVDSDVRTQVVRLGKLAIAAGADGLVCSAHEIAPLRDALGAGPVLVVPGIRPAGSDKGDQARVMTPRQAIDAGADYIVVGRPITQSSDPVAAVAAILAEIG